MAKKACLLVVAMLGFSWCTGSKCPPEPELQPHCWCLESSYSGGSVFCKNFHSPSEVRAPMEACEGYDVSTLAIYNSTLLYLPQDVFKGTSFQKIALINTALMSLSEGPTAFEGLEDTMVELRASQTHYVTNWRISQLRKLKNMDLLDINHIHLEAIEEGFPEFPKITVIGFVHAALTFLGDHTFAQCPQLEILDLRHNFLPEMKRSMLPRPANKLTVLNLEGNQLSSFPEDFFTEMPSLTTLLLSRNQFITIQEYSFGKIFRQLNTLDLTENAIRCDCRLVWLVEGKQPHYFDAKCDKPSSLQGSLIKLISKRDLHCY